MFGIPGWAIGVAFIILAISVGKALVGLFLPADHLRGRKTSRPDLAQALEEVQRRLSELEDAQRRLGQGEDVQARLSEVEERLGFAERLLAKQPDADRMTPPKAETSPTA